MGAPSRITFSLSSVVQRTSGRTSTDPVRGYAAFTSNPGSSAGQNDKLDALFFSAQTLAQGTGGSINLRDGSLRNGLGTQVQWTALIAMYVHVTSATGQLSVQTTIGGSNLFVPSGVYLMPGEAFQKAVNFDASAYLIGADADAITIANIGSGAVTYDLALVGAIA